MFRKNIKSPREAALEYELSLSKSQLKVFRRAVDLYRQGIEKKEQYDEKATALLTQDLPEDGDVDGFINELMEETGEK